MAAEGNIVGEVGLIVKPVDPGFNAGVKRIIDKIERDAQFKVAANTQQAQESLRGLDSQVAGLNNGLVQSAVNVAGITAAFFALKGAANQVIGKFAGLFDQLAQAKAGFSSILKSENAGNTLLGDIQEFARVSPFVTQELVNYSQQLLGVGLSAEKIVPLLEDVGNIISSVGGDTQNMGRVLFTLTQIQSIGRLAGQDAMQLQSALIPITKYLSEFLGKTTAEVKKLQEQGKISAETVFQAIAAQGDNVEGAMAKATRNIAGARAILGDTITIMLQNQPVLNKVFEDIFKGILAFSNYLSEDEVQTSINEFFEGVNKIYESLKPLVESIVDLSGSAGLGGFKAFTSVLNAFASAIEIIPESWMKVFAAFIVGLTTVKAPLMLMKYVVSIHELAKGALNAGVTLSRTSRVMDEQAAAAQRAALAVQGLANAQAGLSRGGMPFTSGQGILEGGVLNKGRISRLANANIGGYAGIGLAAGGTLIQDGQGGGRDAVGQIAQFAGMGAMIGGPWGAAAGGAIGAITSIMSASRKAADEIKKHALAAAASWATAIQEQIKAQYGDASDPDAIREFLTVAGQGEAVIANYEKRLSELRAEQEAVDVTSGGTAAENAALWDSYNALGDKIGATSDVLKQYKLEQEALFKDSEYVDYLTAVAAKMALIADAVPDQSSLPTNPFANLQISGTSATEQRAQDLVTGQVVPENLEDLEIVQKQLEKWGVTMDTIYTKTKEEVVTLVKTFTSLPDVTKNALEATTLWNTKLKEAKATADLLWGPEQERLGSLISYQNTLTSSMEAQIKAGMELTNVTAQLTAERDALALKSQVYATTLANTNDIIQATIAAEGAYALALANRAVGQDRAAYATRYQTEEVVTQMLKLAGVADTLENREILIEVALKNMGPVLAEIDTLTAKIIEMRTMLNVDPTKLEDMRKGLAESKAELDAMVAGSLDPQIAADLKAEEERRNGEQRRKEAEEAAKKAAEEARRAAEEAQRAAERWADQVASATTSLTNSIAGAAADIVAAAQAWIGSIKERTQYEQAVSATRLASNANRQIADVAELQAGIQNLKSRGLSQAMLDALGIDNVTDTRQVRKLVNATDADLAALAASMSALDASATGLAQQQEDKRTRDNITQAILDAAKQLDLKIGKDQAASISNTFTITPGTNAEDIALQILNILTSGRIAL